MVTEDSETRVNQLQGQLDLMQLRQEKLHRQIINYEAEIEQLHQEKRLLEQTVQELPEIYRLKFQARLEPIRQRIEYIQAENRQLRTDLYELSFQLNRTPYGAQDARRWSIPRLPQFSRPDRKLLTSSSGDETEQNL